MGEGLVGFEGYYKGFDIGTLICRIGLGVYYTRIILRNPQDPILIIKVSTLRVWDLGSL